MTWSTAEAWWIILGVAFLCWLAHNKTEKYRKETNKSMIDKNALALAAADVARKGGTALNVPSPKYGDEIFETADSPRTWDEYIGQESAKKMLRMAIKSALFRKARLEHVLIASPAPGVGKSALARLIGAEMGVGVVEIQDTLDVNRARAIIGGMKDGDILVWDEFHQALNKGKSTVEWLLPFLQDGTLPDPEEGLKKMPNITLVAATTDYENFPETIMSRFRIRPELTPYSLDEFCTIARQASTKFFDDEGLPSLTDETITAVALASGSPRLMKNLLANLRDAFISEYVAADENGNLDLAPVLDMMGLTADGLTSEMTNYMLKLYALGGGPVGGQTLWTSLGLPERPVTTEGALMQRGLLVVNSAGRCLTEAGKSRVVTLLKDMGILEAETA